MLGYLMLISLYEHFRNGEQIFGIVIGLSLNEEFSIGLMWMMGVLLLFTPNITILQVQICWLSTKPIGRNC